MGLEGQSAGFQYDCILSNGSFNNYGHSNTLKGLSK
jgi:hypothetical protein